VVVSSLLGVHALSAQKHLGHFVNGDETSLLREIGPKILFEAFADVIPVDYWNVIAHLCNLAGSTSVRPLRLAQNA
jgi:hypothetical protein